MDHFYRSWLNQATSPGIYAIPSPDDIPWLLQYFNKTLDEYKYILAVGYKDVLFKVWLIDGIVVTYDEKNNIVFRHGIAFEAAPKILINRKKSIYGVYIHGLLADKDLLGLIRHFIPFKTPIDQMCMYEHPRNTWQALNNTVHPNLVFKLYDEFGVSGWKELFPSTVDEQKFAEIFDSQIESHSTMGDYKIIFEDGQIIYMMGFNERGIYLRTWSDIPNAARKWLLSIRENMKNPVGRILPHKDLLQLIITGEIKGRKLIELCNLNSEIRDSCNANDQYLFRQRLADEFKINWESCKVGYPDARSLYMQLHTLYAYELPRKGIETTVVDCRKILLPPYQNMGLNRSWVPTRNFDISFFENNIPNFQTWGVEQLSEKRWSRADSYLRDLYRDK